MKHIAAIALAVLATSGGLHAAPVQNIDAEHSRITVYVYKQGLFSFLADNHVIQAPIARGSYDEAHGSIDVSVDVSKMRVLDPRLSAGKRASVQANMLGPQVLDAAKYPTIAFQSTSLTAEPSGALTVTGNLQLHGQTHSITFQAKNDGRGHFAGSTTVRQTAYGITPIKIAGGAVSVKDDVRIDFEVALTNV